MQNWRDTLLSQFANSPRIIALIDAANSAIDPSTDIDSFYEKVFNVETAEGAGLDIWGRIVGVSRSFPGLAAALDDESYRTLILIKAFANVAATNIPTLNDLLVRLVRLLPGAQFGPYAIEGYVDTGYVQDNGLINPRCYVADLGGMQMLYVFEFVMQAYQFAVIANSGAMPRPTGVGAWAQQIDTSGTFGFSGSGMQPFGHGVFGTGAQPIA